MRKRNSFSPLKIMLLGVPFAVILLFIYFNFLGVRKSLFVSPMPSSFKSLITNLRNKPSVDPLKALLSKSHIKFSSVVEKGDSSFYIKLSSGEEVVVASEKSLDKQISSLQFILSRLTIEGKRFSRLDLRFDKPVIIFK